MSTDNMHKNLVKFECVVSATGLCERRDKQTRLSQYSAPLSGGVRYNYLTDTARCVDFHSDLGSGPDHFCGLLGPTHLADRTRLSRCKAGVKRIEMLD